MQTPSVIGTIARVRFVIDEDSGSTLTGAIPLSLTRIAHPTAGGDMDIFLPDGAWEC